MGSSKLTALVPLFFCQLAFADDTELYVTDIASRNNLKPQVMIIFDTSGSMKTNETVSKAAFDPNEDYANGNAPTKIFWAKEGEAVPSLSSTQYFDVAVNFCNASINPLSKTGRYTGNVRRWNSGNQQWMKLNGTQGRHFECKEDVLNNDSANPGDGYNDSGFPVNNESDPFSKESNGNVFTGDDAVALYTANYLAWYAKDNEENKSRLSIAQETVSDLVASTPSVNFGLMAFNLNYGDTSQDGGRVITALGDMEAADRAEYLAQIASLKAKGNTPLCESLYEAYRYFGGKKVHFGDNDTVSKPKPDDTAYDSQNRYVSPFKTCQDRAYVILMTDGQPIEDRAADSLISSLTGESASSSYLPTLAGWLNGKDINTEKEGEQNLTTYTIGFGENATSKAGSLLRNTALKGGGAYFAASDSKDLQQAFQQTIIEILNQTSSFNAPAVSASKLDKTQHNNSIYYSMFTPSKKAVWNGNLKKLSINDQGILVDRNQQPAIDSNGHISAKASTFWNGKEDGAQVMSGGVAQALANAKSRKVLSNLGANGALVELNIDNLLTHFELTKKTELASELGLTIEELPKAVSWLQGYDVDDYDEDNDRKEFRNNIFSDPLHSKPLPINLSDSTDSDTHIMVGTNSGFLHFFTDTGDDVSEQWAFIPASKIKSAVNLKRQKDSSQHHYGIDGSPVVMKLFGKTGNLRKAIALVGMRRGGDAYFAFDITRANLPKLLWQINAKSNGFSELGQTWSQPVASQILHNSTGEDEAKSVFIFGAGYDDKLDTCKRSESENCATDKGRAIYIVEAETGDKVAEFGVTSCQSTSCIKHGIAAPVTLLDSNEDGFTDRIYAVDTGASVWRVDLPSPKKQDWSMIQLADLAENAKADDRRFFNPPTVVRTYHQNVVKAGTTYDITDVPFDGVLVGSGNRAAPATDKTTSDQFVMLQDRFILPTQFGSDGVQPPEVLTLNDLYNITNDPVGNFKGGNILDVKAQLSDKRGWKYNLLAAGEKSLGGALVIDGTVYFTSFTPSIDDSKECGINELGTGKMYAVNIYDGTDTHSWRSREIGSHVPDTLVVHSGTNEAGDSTLRILGAGKGEAITIEDVATGDQKTVNSGTQTTNGSMAPSRIYSFFEEM
ncbi:pilus assembly protein [Motilimonas pumila]|uniref:VWFA domain-containing protein n=1 Tax=Motilimonas pumila TaxID=2303987 RepID=A0A418YG74_9GAMM|nr:PilC/PilY family type IV pilus protein [Motilimonas pumila]RJG48659.1 hypothetical protein D1Z90_07305 [Motilimonas pumila]